jgi:hypothetical protein
MTLNEFIEISDTFNLNIRYLPKYQLENLYEKYQETEGFKVILNKAISLKTSLTEEEFNSNIFSEILYLNYYYLFNKTDVPFIFYEDLLKIIFEKLNVPNMFTFIIQQIEEKKDCKNIEDYKFLKFFMFCFISNINYFSQYIDKKASYYLYSLALRLSNIFISNKDFFIIYDFCICMEKYFTTEQNTFISNNIISACDNYIFIA